MFKKKKIQNKNLDYKLCSTKAQKSSIRTLAIEREKIKKNDNHLK